MAVYTPNPGPGEVTGIQGKHPRIPAYSFPPAETRQVMSFLPYPPTGISRLSIPIRKNVDQFLCRF